MSAHGPLERQVDRYQAYPVTDAYAVSGPATDEMLQEAKAVAQRLDVETETQLRELAGGRAADAIVQDASDAGCDVIVIGTHGRRGLSRALLGSDAERVLRQSPVPVLHVSGKGRVGPQFSAEVYAAQLARP
jgi:nucleotide-binding universal stress UspA family protein